MLLMLGSLAHGGATAVERGERKEVEGPAVVLDELTYRLYVADSRNLPACLEALEEAIDEGLKANERTLLARDIAKREFDIDEALQAAQVQSIATQAATLADLSAKNDQLRNQRNVALGVATGFLAAAATAVVLSLN